MWLTCSTPGVLAYDAPVSTPFATFQRHPHLHARALCSTIHSQEHPLYAQKSRGGHPSCDPAPRTFPLFGSNGVCGSAGTGQWLPTPPTQRHRVQCSTYHPQLSTLVQCCGRSLRTRLSSARKRQRVTPYASIHSWLWARRCRLLFLFLSRPLRSCLRLPTWSTSPLTLVLLHYWRLR